MKLISSLLAFIFILTSCQFQDSQKNVEIVVENIIEKKNQIIEKKTEKKDIKKTRLYLVGEPYYIQGVKHIPEENYSYSKKGLASYYSKELHNVKTINNEYNKVTELLGRHKTLPIPSIVKITNLENGLSLILRVNDRHNDNASIIQVSRKAAQLLGFYKNKIARVKVEILSDSSKQIKTVTKSMSDPLFNETFKAVPTENVIETDLEDSLYEDKISENIPEQPIELIFEKIADQNLFIKIYGFKTYEQIKKIILELEIDYKTTIEKDGETYNLLLGPIENLDAKKLVSTFISKGYKKTEIIII